MRSDKLPDMLDLERDIPTTPEDVRALRENRPKPDLHWLDQLQILVDQVPNAHELRWQRRTFAGWEPFEL